MNAAQYSSKGRHLCVGRTWSEKMDVHQGTGDESQVKTAEHRGMLAILRREGEKKTNG